jgi:hypothetical protein
VDFPHLKIYLNGELSPYNMDTNQAQTELDCFKLESEEPYVNGANKVKRMFQAIYPRIDDLTINEMARKKFVSLLPPNIRQTLNIKNVPNFVEAAKEADRLRNIISNVATTSNEEVIQLRREVEKLKLKQIALPRVPYNPVNRGPYVRPIQHFNYAPRPTFRSQAPNNHAMPNVTVCYKCQKPGHIARNCFSNNQVDQIRAHCSQNIVTPLSGNLN